MHALLIAATPTPVPVVVNLSGAGTHVTWAAFLLGVATVVLANVVIQLWLVPRADLGKRADDRWERDVRELVDLMGQQASASAAELRQAGWLMLYYVAERSKQLPPDEYATRVREVRERVRVAIGPWRADQERASWLTTLIVARAPNRLANLERVAFAYEITHHKLDQPAYVSDLDVEGAAEMFATWDRDWDTERDRRSAFLYEAKALARENILRSMPGERRVRKWVGSRWRALQGRLARRRAVRRKAPTA